MELTISEKKIIQAIIEKNKQKTSNFRLIDQLENLKVGNREKTGVGLYINFFIENPKSYFVNNLNLRLGGIHGNILTLEYGAQFVLYIENGLIKCLECVCYNEVWPAKFVIKELFDVQKDGSLVVHKPSTKGD